METLEEGVGVFSLTHSTLGGKRACWSSRMGIRMNDKQVNYSHECAQTKQQVTQCVVETLLMHKQAMGIHRLTKLTMTQIWGKIVGSPLQYFICLAMGPTPKCHFVPRLPSLESRNSRNWDSYNFGRSSFFVQNFN